MNICEMKYATDQYGTPLYVFDLDKLRRRVHDLREKIDTRIRICFAMKANPFLTRIMSGLTDRIEVCSMGEYRICGELGIEPENLLISGVLKERDDLHEILDHYRGRCSYTIESRRQFYQIVDWCDVNKESVDVFFRLTSGNQFGMDEETMEDILSLRSMFPYINIRGLHYFSGTQKKSMEKIRQELRELDLYCRALEEKLKFPIQELEYGPGIPVSYFTGQRDQADEMIMQLNREVAAMKWKGRVTLEMGRALCAACGYYLTTVKDIKQNQKVNYCIVDGGIHQIHYDGQIRSMYQPIFHIYAKDLYETEVTHSDRWAQDSDDMEETQTEHEWTICGSLCTANDVLVQNVKLDQLKIGSVLVFENVGAYAMTEGMSLFLSHDLPGVAFYGEEDGWRLLRGAKPTYLWNMEETEDERTDEYFDGNR